MASEDREKEGRHQSSRQYSCQRVCALRHSFHLCGQEEFLHAPPLQLPQRRSTNAIKIQIFICVLHFVPNGIKLRGHIGSELQRKAAGILSIEKDENPEYSVVKALKVRDGSPLDVPMTLFGWDKALDMHVYRGEKSKEDKDKRKSNELHAVIRDAFRSATRLSYQQLCEILMRELDIKDRTAKKYIAYMKEQGILIQDSQGNYQQRKTCLI